MLAHGTCKLYIGNVLDFFLLIFLHAEPNKLWLIEGLWDLASEHRVDCADYHQEDRVAGGKQVIVQFELQEDLQKYPQEDLLQNVHLITGDIK